jgi:hypothetical protein
VTGHGIAPALQQWQANERLYPIHKGGTGLQRVFVIKRYGVDRFESFR